MYEEKKSISKNIRIHFKTIATHKNQCLYMQ